MDEEDRGKRVPESEIDRKFSGPDSDSLIKQPPQKISKKKNNPLKKRPSKKFDWTVDTGFQSSDRQRCNPLEAAATAYCC